MSKHWTKSAGRFDQMILPTAIALLTAAYLLLTAGGVGLPVTSSNTKITYDTTPITYGDVYFMSEANFGESYYGKANDTTNTPFYTSKAASTSSSTTFQMYNRYETITFNDHAAPSDTIPMVVHTYDRFYKGYVETTIDTGIGNGTLPVLSTESTGIYTVVPGSTGDYYVYVYAENDPTDAVKYTLIDNAANANAYEGTSTSTLSFTNVAEKWWRAKVTVSYVGWQAVVPKCTKSSVTQTSSKSDTGLGTKTSSVLENSLLGNNPYYYNIWDTDAAVYDTLLVLQWDQSVQIGLVGKEGNVTINNGTNGTVSAQTAFGETVAVGSAATVIHAPLYITGVPSGDYVFAGLTLSSDNSAVETTALSADTVSYVFMSDVDVVLTAAWEKAVELPTITVALNDAVQTELNFLTAKTGSTTFAGGTDAAYSFTVGFGESDVTAVSYTVSGEVSTSGTLTADEPVCTVNAMWANSTVTFQVTQGGSSYTITYTLKCVNTGSAIAMIEETGDTFSYLEDALVAANSTTETRTVVVLRDASFYEGTPNTSWTSNNAGYTIGSNVTLLVPYAPNATTVDTATNTDGISGTLIHANKTFVASNTNALDTEAGKYLTVTIPESITLNISDSGKFVVGGTIGSANGIAGATVGDHSNVVLNGTLNIADGGILSCCGYILGTGTINAESGAEIYQPFVVMDYRGGSFTYESSEDIAPFTRFTVQNLQTRINLTSGALLYGYCDLYTGAKSIAGLYNIPAQHNLTTGLIIGGSNTDAAVLKLADGATLTSTYDADTYVSSYDKVGKTTLEISGGASLGVMLLEVNVGSSQPMQVSTEDVMFPLPYNYDIRLNGSDSTYTMGYSFGIQPGARVEVGEGATLNVGNSSSFQFMVFDGLYDHTSTGSEVTYGQSVSYRYPLTEELQSAPFNGTGAGSLVVNGTLNILSGANFGGVVETSGTTGQVIIDAKAVASCTTITGMVSSDYAGRTERTLAAEVVDTGTGLRTTMVPGKTYKAKEGSSVLPSYTYNLYTKNGTSEEYTETLNALISGSWYNYTATIKMVDSNGNELSSYETWFCHNADISALNLYRDSTCETKATTVETDELVLYSKSEDAEASLNGESYFPTLLEAVRNASGSGDKVELLKNITLTQSIPVDKKQNVTVSLGGKNINYSATPFINDGTLTLQLEGAAISNLAGSTYTVAPAVTNNTGAMATVDLGGGSITVQAPADSTAQIEGIVNYGTLVIKDTAETPGSINVYGALGAAGKDYVLETNYNTTTYPTVTVNAELAAQNFTVMPIYVGIYNAGTIEKLSDVTVHSPQISVYNGAAAHIKYAMTGINTKAIPDEGETTSKIESISGATLEGGWASVLNAFGRIDEISDSTLKSTGRMLITDAGTAYAALYNYLGQVGTISDSKLLSNDTMTLTRYRYAMDGVNAELGDVTVNSSNARQTTSNTVYGIYNFGWITADATKSAGHNLRTSSIDAITNCVIEANGTPFNADVFTANADQITSSFYDDAPNNERGYGIYNSGSTIGDITGGSITGNRGIYNVNLVYTKTTYGENQTTSNYTWKKDLRIVPEAAVGTIGDIIDCDVLGTYSHGLMNYGLVGTIGGDSTFAVDARATTGYAIYNYGSWYGTTTEEATITERAAYTDSTGATKYRNTKVTKEYQNYKAPAEDFNDAESYWTGIDVPTIEAITDQVTITGINNTASNDYGRGLGNAGRINYISGSGVTIKAQTGTYQASPKRANYAIMNTAGYIGEITGAAEIGADYSYALSNQDARIGYSSTEYVYEDDSSTTQKQIVDTVVYVVPAYIATIGGGGSDAVEFTAAKGTAVNNNAYIGDILQGVTISATGSAALVNTEGRLAGYKNIRTSRGANGVVSGRYDMTYERNYDYAEEGGWIGKLEGATISATGSYAVNNYGTIDEIGSGVQLTAASQYALYNQAHYSGTRTTIRYYYGTSVMATTSGYFGETNLVYTKAPAEVGVINGAELTAKNDAIANGGEIGKIINSTITASNARAISNTLDVKQMSYENGALITQDDTGAYVLTAAESIEYGYGLIELIGGGNTITAGSNTIYNSGAITAFDSTRRDEEAAEKSTVKATGGVALYNYRGLTAANEAGTKTYRSATIGTVKNVDIIGTSGAILNGDGNGTYTAVTIAELGEGLIANATNSSAYAVKNATSNAAIELISGGDYLGGGSASRSYAIYDPDNQNYPEGKTLSQKTRSAILADGITKIACYYITVEDPNVETVTGENEEDTGIRVEYTTLADAIAAYQNMTDAERENTYIVLTDNTTETEAIKTVVKEDVYLDLNGYTVDLDGNVFDLNGKTLYGMDSKTNSYSIERGYGTIIGTIEGEVAVLCSETGRGANGDKSYVTYTETVEPDTGENTATSFHRVNITPTAYQFYFNEKDHSHMAFQATFQADSIATALLQDIGFLVNSESDSIDNTVYGYGAWVWYSDSHDGVAPAFAEDNGNKQISFIALDYAGAAGFEDAFSVSVKAAFDQDRTYVITSTVEDSVTFRGAMVAKLEELDALETLTDEQQYVWEVLNAFLNPETT